MLLYDCIYLLRPCFTISAYMVQKLSYWYLESECLNIQFKPCEYTMCGFGFSIRGFGFSGTLNPALRFSLFSFLFFFLFFLLSRVSGKIENLLFMRQMLLFMHCSDTIHGSHDTTHQFKIYFATVFSVFSFSKNKFNPNRPYVLIMKAFLL